jgi:hypothetical protein
MTLLSVITKVVMAAAMLAYAGMFKLLWVIRRNGSRLSAIRDRFRLALASAVFRTEADQGRLFTI